jgi:hypothetical protein
MQRKRIVQTVIVLALLGVLTACSSNSKFRINSSSFDSHLSCRGAEYSGGRCTDSWN